jgi:hypothetical protein
MKRKTGILIILALFFLIGMVTANLPDASTISTSDNWVVANGADQTTITVTAINATSGIEKNADVQFTIDNQNYGSISPSTNKTDDSGIAQSTFRVNKTSGNANITARIVSTDGYTVTRYININIDHDSPYFVNFAHPPYGTVANDVPFNISLTDKWGNRIDYRRGSHIINLQVHGPAPDDCGFRVADTSNHKISSILDSNGKTSTILRLTSKMGPNYILMDHFGSIPDTLEWVEAEATDMPYSMTGSISDGGILPVGNKAFTLDYVLYDVYGNPVKNSSVWVNSSEFGPNEQKLLTSNSLGQIRLTYGPKANVKTITLTATSVNNSSVTKILLAQFTTAQASNMVLAITPQSMASREIPTSQPAQVVGKVTDMFGNPVGGQEVAFQISDSQTSPFVATGAPSFNSASVVSTINATTNSDGNAIVYFYPGSFTIQQNDPYFSDKASGSCWVTATWNSYSAPPVKMEWKNFPYLSIVVNATPQAVHVNDTIDVAIQVRGDGYMMGTRPVTVMLDMDASSSLNSGSRGPDAKASSKKFVDNLTPSLDQAGLVSYGDDDNEVFHSNASYNFFNVKGAIDNLTLKGGVSGNSAISVKQSVDEGVYRIMHNPTLHAQEVRAIILLGDSSYDSGELPALVKETWGSDGNDIRVFTIMFLSSNNGCGSGTDSKLIRMKDLAAQAGGKYYCGSDKNAIDDAYADIAGILKSLAGVNATMDLSFDNVEVNSTPVSGGQVFTYVPETKTIWPNSTITYKNQSDEWKAPDYLLHFNIGTIHINEIWEAQYRLRIDRVGLIKLFDDSSTLTFNNGTETIRLPDIYITSGPSNSSIGLNAGTLDVSNLIITNSGSITDFIPVTWKLKYTGFASVKETMWYSHNNGPWLQFSSNSDIDAGDYVHNAQLDVRKLPPGGYRIKIHAVGPDAPDDEEISSVCTVGGNRVYIKLEAPPVENFEFPWDGMSLSHYFK